MRVGQLRAGLKTCAVGTASSLSLGEGVALARAGLGLLAASLAVAACGRVAAPETQAGSAADYGDAPDERGSGYANGAAGHFPTRASSNGARVADPSSAWLGSPGSLEKDVTDPSDPDGQPNLERDRDDGLLEMMLDTDASPPRATLKLRVGQQDPGRQWWLNILVDLDQDGRWHGAEWVVQNSPVLSTPGGRPLIQQFTYSSHGPSGGVATPNNDEPSGAARGSIPERAWMRVALTDRQVPAHWEGQGWFEAGEVEDHLVEFGGSGTAGLALNCEDPSSPSGVWGFNGSRHVRVECTLGASGHGALGPITLDLKRTSGGVTHSGLCGQTPVRVIDKDQVEVGPIALHGSTMRLGCTFTKDWPLPSVWSLRARLGAAPSSPTEFGIRMGHSGKLAETFKIEKGACLRTCSTGHSCSGDDACIDGCCGPAWAAECGQLDAEACGRCCAVTGGVHAGQCVRQACVQ